MVPPSVGEPVPEPVRVPGVPPVPVRVERSAKALALKVWEAASAQPRGYLFPGVNPATLEEFVSHAAAMDWVVVDGDLLAPGSVNPIPVETWELPV